MKELSPKKWFCKCIITLIVLLLLIAGTMFVIDPYFHYHKPLSFLSHRLYEERYINDGITRHYDYNAVITGTSMSQNFKTSEMDAIFGTTSIKVPFPGAGYQELTESLERTLNRNNSVHTVIWVLDHNGLLREYDWRQYNDYPTYLYDDNPFNDASYLFNKAVFYHGVLPSISMTLTGTPTTSMDEYSSFQRETGLARILDSYDRNALTEDPDSIYTAEMEAGVTKTITENFVNLVNQYPDVTFYIFYSPYSICYWDALYQQNMMSKQLAAELTATELLLECPNVKLYNFFDQYDVICNTDYYCDLGHYDSRINSRILQWIHDDTGLITKENYKEKHAEETEFYMTYDYDSIFE